MTNETVQTFLLAAILVVMVGYMAAAMWPVRSEKKAVPPAAEPTSSVEPRPTPTDQDKQTESIIQTVDPSWKIGDTRDHIELVPGPDGHIAKARLK